MREDIIAYMIVSLPGGWQGINTLHLYLSNFLSEYFCLNEIIILGIESSCDDTAAAVFLKGKILSNVVAGQEVHKAYGGVVPEWASRAHQKNIVPVVHQALKSANIDKSELTAIAFTKGPGLLGSLLVGVSFAKAMALGLNIPLLEVNHLQAHILAHFIKGNGRQGTGDGKEKEFPGFPFLCLTVSGGHTQIVLVKDHLEMEVIGRTIDDAAGEAFDKAAKIIGLPYPGGPLIDKVAAGGNALAFEFPHPKIASYDYSFSGIKTAFLYFIRDNIKKEPDFINMNKSDICASIQKTIVDVLLNKLIAAACDTGIKDIAIAGGVAANSHLRSELESLKKTQGWHIYIPARKYCTDNAAMIAIAGYYKYLKGAFADQSVSAEARYPF